MKGYVYTEQQLARLVTAIDSLQVRGINQANAIVVCQQVLDAPHKVIEVEEEKEGK